MTRADQNAQDDEIVLAALPGDFAMAWRALADVYGPYIHDPKRDGLVKNALQRLKRAGKVRYVRETKRWERVIEL